MPKSAIVRLQPPRLETTASAHVLTSPSVDIAAADAGDRVGYLIAISTLVLPSSLVVVVGAEVHRGRAERRLAV